MVGKRLFDLFDYRSSSAAKNGRELLVDPELLRHIAHRREADRLADWQPRGRGRPGNRGSEHLPAAEQTGRVGGARPRGLLAITFIFSRAGCDAAVKQCLRSSLRLTTDEERKSHRRGDRPSLWRPGRSRPDRPGLPRMARRTAARAGGTSRRVVPVFRHTVEELFTDGLGKAVFATETLALGINMPARTVVLERLVKFNGEQHMPLTPGSTQLTGRAGRRGIDVEGHAVVLWHPDVEPAEVAGLASTRTFPLRSSFAPSYNMTINLVNQMGPAQAHQLLERSFAQYQADRSVVGLVRGVTRGERMLDEIAAELGGMTRRSWTTPGCRHDLERERAQSRASRLQRRKAANDSLAALRRGDIITITHGRRGGLAVVLEPDRDGDDPRPLVLTENRWAGRISSADYSGASAPLGSMSLPKRVEHRQPRVRRDVASALRSAAAGLATPPAKGRRGGPAPERDVDPELASLREQLRRHPAHRLPDREAKIRLAERYLRIERDNAQIRQKVAAATNSLARTFDRIVALLTERGVHRRRPR